MKKEKKNNNKNTKTNLKEETKQETKKDVDVTDEHKTSTMNMTNVNQFAY